MNRNDVLTLKEFWIPLKEKYPDALEHYCVWIDQLKLDVRWQSMFCQQSYLKKEPRIEGEREYRTPKAHELQAFLQVGIFLQYVAEHSNHAMFEVTGDWQKIIENYFHNRQLEY